MWVARSANVKLKLIVNCEGFVRTTNKEYDARQQEDSALSKDPRGRQNQKY